MKAKPKKEQDTKLKVPVKARENTFCEPLEYHIAKDVQIDLDKSYAFDFLELKTFNGERAVREGHVQYLLDQLCSGRFVWHHVMLASAILDGQEYRINGQHTCWMRVNVPDKLEPISSHVRRITYHVDSEENLKALYSAFDRAAARTATHLGTVQLLDTEATREIPKSLIGKLVQGFKVFFSEEYRTSGIRIDETTALIQKNYAQLFNIVGRYFQIHYNDCHWIKRAAILGAMMATFEKNVKASDEFWGPVFCGIGLEKRMDPRWQLRRFCEGHAHTIVRGQNKISQEDLFRVCLNAWNHWRNGTEITKLYLIDARPKLKA